MYGALWCIMVHNGTYMVHYGVLGCIMVHYGTRMVHYGTSMVQVWCIMVHVSIFFSQTCIHTHINNDIDVNLEY